MKLYFKSVLAGIKVERDHIKSYITCRFSVQNIRYGKALQAGNRVPEVKRFSTGIGPSLMESLNFSMSTESIF
jgi:hypothetical protein